MRNLGEEMADAVSSNIMVNVVDPSIVSVNCCQVPLANKFIPTRMQDRLERIKASIIEHIQALLSMSKIGTVN